MSSSHSSLSLATCWVSPVHLGTPLRSFLLFQVFFCLEESISVQPLACNLPPFEAHGPAIAVASTLFQWWCSCFWFFFIISRLWSCHIAFWDIHCEMLQLFSYQLWFLSSIQNCTLGWTSHCLYIDGSLFLGCIVGLPDVAELGKRTLSFLQSCLDVRLCPAVLLLYV